MAGVYVVIQLIEGSVLVPLVMRNTIGISPLLVLLSLLVGGAVGGLVGAFLAVPIAASVEIVLSRLQARETPVAQDPAAIETPDEDARDEHQRSLPDAGRARLRRRDAASAASRPAGDQPRAATAIPRDGGRRRDPPPRRHSARRPTARERRDRGQVDERRRIGRLEPMTGRAGRAMEDVALGQDLDVVLPLDRHPARR